MSEALNAEATNNNEQQDTDMEDIELSMQGTQPGQNEYNDKFAESPSEFDSVILDAETKKRLSEAKDSNGKTAKKKKSLTIMNKTRNRNGRGR